MAFSSAKVSRVPLATSTSSLVAVGGACSIRLGVGIRRIGRLLRAGIAAGLVYASVFAAAEAASDASQTRLPRMRGHHMTSGARVTPLPVIQDAAGKRGGGVASRSSWQGKGPFRRARNRTAGILVEVGGREAEESGFGFHGWVGRRRWPRTAGALALVNRLLPTAGSVAYASREPIRSRSDDPEPFRRPWT